MTISELYIQAKKGVLLPSVLLSGEEEYPIFQYITVAKKQVGFPELNILELKEPFTYEDVEEAFESTPMMDSFRLVILHKTGYFKWNKDKRFYDLFQNIPAHIRLIVFEQELNKVSANYKRFVKTAEIIESKPFNKAYYQKWLRGKFKDYEITPKQEIIDYLAELSTEKGMYEAKNAVDYLASLSWELTRNDINNYFGAPSDEDIWALYDSFARADFPLQVEKLLRQGFDAMELFGRISSVFRNATKKKAGVLKASPFMSKVAARIASKFSDKALQQVMVELAKTDVELKSVFAKKEHLVISLSIKIAALRNN